MPLDLWFRDDISRVLASTHETFRASAAFRSDSAPALDPLAAETVLAYQQGVCDALRAIALAFGVCSQASRAGALAVGEDHRFSLQHAPATSPAGWLTYSECERGRP
jgi:hypothetical protein